MPRASAPQRPLVADLEFKGVKLRPGSRDWVERLRADIEEARDMLWTRIQAGSFQGPSQATAATDAYKVVSKALTLLDKGLSQLSLSQDGAGEEDKDDA